MAEARRYGITPQLDIAQILLEAQHRWLRPAEICEILRNYQRFQITPEPPNRPPSGSLFLFDRKVLRYFRKDGHNWRKKKDGKTVKEAHERLKAGSIDVLHCYYAHGEDDGNFQRRSYWMLEEDLMHIVLVHYREVKSKESHGRSKDAEGIPQDICEHSPVGSNSGAYYNQIASQATDSGSPNSAQTSEYEDPEFNNYQATSRYHTIPELCKFGEKPIMDNDVYNSHFPVFQSTTQGNHQRQGTMASGSDPNLYFVSQEETTGVFDETGLGMTFNGPKTQFDMATWDEVLEHCTAAFNNTTLPSLGSSTLPFGRGNIPGRDHVVIGQFLGDELSIPGESSTRDQGQAEWKFNGEASSRGTSDVDIQNTKYASLLKQLSLDFNNKEGDKGLQKLDSFSKWMSKELGEVDSHTQSRFGTYWDEVESVVQESSLSNEEHLESYLLSPVLSQDQLFSINDFSPKRAYADSETEVLITGAFLGNQNDIEKHKWSCMFGQVEVPADILADGRVRCYAPPHKVGRVPFYVTCSNRLACSEVREFEYHTSNNLEAHTSSALGDILYLRLEKLLSDISISEAGSDCFGKKAHICNKITSLLVGDNDVQSPTMNMNLYDGYSHNSNDERMQNMLKEKLHSWLLCKVAEDGKGPNILDSEGQGVIHLAAALGLDWAMAPIIASGVTINFRDAHGWTALHWAASHGREKTVITLLSLGASPGLLTDPSSNFPSGITPADLASSNRHKGIAGFLAEHSLTTHLSTLNLNQSKDGDVSNMCSMNALDDLGEKNSIHYSDGDMQAHLSMKDSLSAVRNAALAAARIHQAFRVDSFHRKELIEFGNDKFGLSDERALSLVSVKGKKTGQHDEPVYAAAVRIQNKFRGWKGRKEFLMIRQRIVKIQAHVRGHQVRKHFRKIVWSVGIVEKVILRWRRKGSGLRGFRSEALTDGSTMQFQPVKENDYDFLQEGRKQTEAGLERALARVKSMVQYPEARDQYQRLLTGVKEFQESKVMLERILHDDLEEGSDGDIMFDIDELIGDDIPTS